MKVAAVVANNCTNTFGRVLLTYFSMEPTFLQYAVGDYFVVAEFNGKCTVAHNSILCAFRPDPKPVDINGTAAIKTRKDCSLGSQRSVPKHKALQKIIN